MNEVSCWKCKHFERVRTSAFCHGGKRVKKLPQKCWYSGEVKFCTDFEPKKQEKEMAIMDRAVITISLPREYVKLLYQMSGKYESPVSDLVEDAIKEYYKDDLERERPCTVASANVESYEESY